MPVMTDRERLLELERQISKVVVVCEALQKNIIAQAEAIQTLRQHSLQQATGLGALQAAFEAISANTEEQPNASH